MRAFVVAFLAYAALPALAAEAEGTPTEKVLTMLEDLQTQVIVEGKTEAKSYDKFACFCKDMSEEKGWDIEDGTDEAADLSAKINELLAERDGLDTVIAEQSEYLEEKEKLIEAATAERRKVHAVFQLNLDDCYRATKEIDMAAAELAAKEKASKASLISLKGMMKSVRRMVLMGDALGLTLKRGKFTEALLQQAPGVPTEDFKFDASEIIKEVKELKPGFEDHAQELKLGELKSVFEHTLVMQQHTDEKKASEKTLEDASERKAEAMKNIASSQQGLTLTSSMVAEDQSYLRELTEVCNAKSKMWDQRSQMRQDELTALTTALSIIKSRVTPVSLVAQKQGPPAAAAASAPSRPQEAARKASAAEEAGATNQNATDSEIAEEANQVEDTSFLQVGLAPPRALAGALVQRAAEHRQLRAPSSDAVRDSVVELLKRRSVTLHSEVLASLASQAASDPFVKIKKLIQELIERMLQEAADEANHKGWCDKEFGKAKGSRARKAEAVAKLHSELSMSEAKRDKLAEDLELLTKELSELESALAKNKKQREEESAENMATISEAEEGKAAIEEAIDLLDKFYKTSAKAEVLSQTAARAPSLADDLPDAGFDGAYKGAGGASGGILGMMDIIKSDFERTVKEATREEKEDAAEFMALETETKSSISSKTIEKQAKDGEKIEVEGVLAEDKASLEEEQSLLDKSIQEIMELQPACVDTGMSYEERVAKREQEIESLKEALCTLDKEGPEQTEPECA